MFIIKRIIIIIYLLLFIAIHNCEENSNSPLLTPGKCKGLWRPDTLPGKCIGINPTREFDDLKHLKISNSNECRALCCNLHERCTTWQYQNSTSTCFIQKRPVRKGPEAADTLLYCDPFAPKPWNGNVLLHRTNGQCQWGESLPNQCFGFGPERISSTKFREHATDKPLNTDQCREACCANKDCNSWQELPGRGCYFGKTDCKKGIVDGGFDGSRKCLPEFCGGMEDIILKKYKEHHPNVKLFDAKNDKG